MPYKFYGGVHPPEFKTLTLDRPIKKPFIPKRVVLPLSQHIGSPSEPMVSVGDIVTTGQVIARPGGFVSSFLHATIGGKVTRISHQASPNHPRALSITIESHNSTEGAAEAFDMKAGKTIEDIPTDDLLEKIKDAGIVGMGGAAFPTHVKLSPPKTKPVDTFIVNGAECEPYLTCDHRLMLERPREILRGVKAIAKVLDVKEAYIAIEDNKLSGIYAMSQALSVLNNKPSDVSIKIVSLKTKYPQGAERQIVKSVLNRTVPAGGLPMDVGCVVQNIGTVFAVYEAVFLSKPLIERVVTITGPCVREPVNIWCRIGTVLSELVEYLGPFAKEPRKTIIGGPMMGISQYTMDIPITKGTGGVIFLSKDDIEESEEGVCIRCGKCLEACPVGLVPTSLMYRVKNEDFKTAKAMGVKYCYECGSCAYACPAKIPLLDYMKFGKAKIAQYE